MAEQKEADKKKTINRLGSSLKKAGGEKKFTSVECFLMITLSATADIVELGAPFLAVALPPLAPVIMIISKVYGTSISAILIFWVTWKRESAKWIWGGGLADLFPGIDLAPWRTIGLLIILLPSITPKKLKPLAGLAGSKAMKMLKKIP